MAYISVKGASLWYECLEATVPWQHETNDVVFCHGVGTNADIWRGWLPELLDGNKLHRFDTRGFGRSTITDASAPWTFDSYIDDIASVMDHAHISRAHLIGESLGGTVSLAFACRYPERVRSLTLASTGFAGRRLNRVGNWRDEIEQKGMAHWSEKMMKARFVDDELDGPRWEWFHRVQAGTEISSLLTAADLLINVDLASNLESVRCPVLLLAPDQSPFIPLSHTVELRDALPDAKLQVFPGCRHGIAFSRDTECAEAYAEFTFSASQNT